MLAFKRKQLKFSTSSNSLVKKIKLRGSGWVGVGRGWGRQRLPKSLFFIFFKHIFLCSFTNSDIWSLSPKTGWAVCTCSIFLHLHVPHPLHMGSCLWFSDHVIYSSGRRGSGGRQSAAALPTSWTTSQAGNNPGPNMCHIGARPQTDTGNSNPPLLHSTSTCCCLTLSRLSVS